MHQDPRITGGQAIWKKWWLYLLLLVGAILLVFTVFSSSRPIVESDISSFVQAARSGRVVRVDVDSDDRHFSYRLRGDSTEYKAVKDQATPVRDILREAGVPEQQIGRIDVREDELGIFGKILRLVIQFVPVVLIISLLGFMLKRAARSGAAKGDPVCGLKVPPKRAAGASTFQEVTYFFCSPEHKAAFDQDPVRYLLKP